MIAFYCLVRDSAKGHDAKSPGCAASNDTKDVQDTNIDSLLEINELFPEKRHRVPYPSHSPSTPTQPLQPSGH